MTPLKRIQDMLPALIVFAIVAVFATYATVAFVVHDARWMQTLVELRQAEAGSTSPAGSPERRAARPALER